MVSEKFNPGDLVVIEQRPKPNEAIGYWHEETGSNILLCNPVNIHFLTKKVSPMIQQEGESLEKIRSNYLKIAKKDVREIKKLYLDRFIHWEELKHIFPKVEKEIDGKLVEILNFMPINLAFSNPAKNYEECYAGRLRNFKIGECRNINGPVSFEVYAWRNKKIKTLLNKLLLKSKPEDFNLYRHNNNQTHVNLLTTEDLSDKLFFPEYMDNLHERVKCPFDLTKLTKDQKDEFIPDYVKLIGRVGIKGMEVIYNNYILEKEGIDDYSKLAMTFSLNTAKLQIRFNSNGTPLFYSPIPVKPTFNEETPCFDEIMCANGKILIPPEYVREFFKAIDERKNPLRILPLPYVKSFKVNMTERSFTMDFEEGEDMKLFLKIIENLGKLYYPKIKKKK